MFHVKHLSMSLAIWDPGIFLGENFGILVFGFGGVLEEWVKILKYGGGLKSGFRTLSRPGLFHTGWCPRSWPRYLRSSSGTRAKLYQSTGQANKSQAQVQFNSRLYKPRDPEHYPKSINLRLHDEPYAYTSLPMFHVKH
jgi:hypothetical protein